MASGCNICGQQFGVRGGLCEACDDWFFWTFRELYLPIARKMSQ